MQVLQSPNATAVIEPQDEAMDQFRRLFKLVAGCKVAEDGKVMVYQMGTLASAARWSNDARAVINSNKLPLKVGVKAVKEKGQVTSVELMIMYHPKDI
jgi:hypothetical protein